MKGTKEEELQASRAVVSKRIEGRKKTMGVIVIERLKEEELQASRL